MTSATVNSKDPQSHTYKGAIHNDVKKSQGQNTQFLITKQFKQNNNKPVNK